MKYQILLMTSILSLLISGCSVSGSKPDNWYQTGYRDGIAGHHQRTYKVLSTLEATQQLNYDEGYAEGVKAFCNPDFAYQIGLSGQYYDGICDGTPNANRFRLEWRRGWEQFNR